MHLGNRRVRAAGTRKRSGDHDFRPDAEWLEERRLLTTELGGNNGSIMQLPAIANVPYGFDFGGTLKNPNGGGGGTLLPGAGWSVADVGSVNGAPYDDFVIGAPTVGNAGGPPNVLGTGVGSGVYVVFGSQTATAGAIQDWIGKTGTVYNYTPTNRVGDLGQLGTSPQTNPINTGPLTYPFAGLTFYTGATGNANSQLGASVAGLKIGGMGAILLGARALTAVMGPLTWCGAPGRPGTHSLAHRQSGFPDIQRDVRTQ